MDKISLVTLGIDLTITIFAYELVPFIAKFILKRQYTKEQSRHFAIVNATIVFVLFSVFRIVVLEADTIGNITPAMLWGYISYLMLQPKKDKKIDYIDNKEISENKQETVENIQIHKKEQYVVSNKTALIIFIISIVLIVASILVYLKITTLNSKISNLETELEKLQDKEKSFEFDDSYKEYRKKRQQEELETKK